MAAIWLLSRRSFKVPSCQLTFLKSLTHEVYLCVIFNVRASFLGNSFVSMRRSWEGEGALQKMG